MRPSVCNRRVGGFLSLVTLSLFVLFSSSSGWAHARLSATGNLPPRSNSAGLKSGPCGNVARTANPKIFNAGETIQVQWEETINHPGRYEFYFSEAGDTNFVLLKSVTDMQNNNNVPHVYSTSLTLPNVACDNCTIQMIQVMTEDANNPSYYYSCADIKLQSGMPTNTSGSTENPNPSCP